jgi:hypothetical protein
MRPMNSYLVGTSEIAELLGVSRQRADFLTKSDEAFPEPEATLTGGRVWSRQAVLTWAKMRGRELELRKNEEGPGPAPNDLPQLLDRADLRMTRFD